MCTPYAGATEPGKIRPLAGRAVLRAVLTVMLLPPVNLAVITLVALLLAGRTRAGRVVAALTCAGLVALSLPVTGLALLASLDPGPLPPPSIPPAAIVILGGDVQRINEAPGLTVGPWSLERMRAGAALHRSTGLPLLSSGGIVDPNGPPIGTLMASGLVGDFAVPVRWTEPVSSDTWANAEQSAALLAQDGVRSVFVVTHAWHMRRALLAFRRAGLEAVPASVRRDRWPDFTPSEFVPRVSAWTQSYLGLHEWLGLIYYMMRQ